MMAQSQKGPTSRSLLLLCGLAVGYGIAQWNSAPQLLQAEVRETTPRAAFQAGSERSEAVLKEIAATLKTIDGRIERLEKLATERKLP
jgi:hypothetical protein